MENRVNHPNHYKMPSGWEAKDVLKLILTEEEYRGWMIGDALIYLMRYKDKGAPVDDIEKARQFLEFLADEYRGKESLVDD